MLRTFDADALLAALPRRPISQIPPESLVRRIQPRPAPQSSALGQTGEYNGFSGRERQRTANLSNWLVRIGCTERPNACAICRASADDEHAENYYDLGSWIGLCQRCHRAILHGRFAKPSRWLELLEKHELPPTHWARLVSVEPFDLAGLLRTRGFREPVKSDFAAD